MSHHNQHQPSSNETKHNNEWPKLKFSGGLDDREAANCEDQGRSGLVLVEFEDGKVFQVQFEAVERVQEWIERRSKEEGLPFDTSPGLILLKDVTLKNMKIAVRKLADEGEFGYFTYLKEWDPEKEKKFHEKFGIPQSTYEYPTVSEEELDEEQ